MMCAMMRALSGEDAPRLKIDSTHLELVIRSAILQNICRFLDFLSVFFLRIKVVYVTAILDIDFIKHQVCRTHNNFFVDFIFVGVRSLPTPITWSSCFLHVAPCCPASCPLLLYLPSCF